MGAYREYLPPAGLEPVAACVWESDVLIDGTQRVVPDGCVDLVWLGDQLVVVGPDTGPVVWEPVGVVACGIRLRPGTACAVLGLPANEVRDQQVPLTSVWPGSAGLSEALDAADPATRLRLLTKAVLHRHAEPDPLIGAALGRLLVPEARVGTVLRPRRERAAPAPASHGRGGLRAEGSRSGREAAQVGRAEGRVAGRSRVRGGLRQPAAHERRGTPADRPYAGPILGRRRADRCLTLSA